MATKVTRLLNYPTKYEITLSCGAQTYLVAYSGRKSKQGLISAIRGRGLDILAITKLDESAAFTFTSATSAQLGDWVVRFTGRTQRDAICTRSEYRYVGTVAAEEHRAEDPHCTCNDCIAHHAGCTEGA
jgi:hypothetical protein